MARIAPQPRRRIYWETYEVDKRLYDLHLSRDLVVEAAQRGDVDRSNAPIFGFDGHPEYAAASRILSTLCEEGGTTDGGWQRDYHAGIPVARSFDSLVLICPTGGTEGTGQVDGEPRNRSEKGPRTAAVAAANRLFDPSELDEAVQFLWLFTYHDGETLWCELFAPILDETGFVLDWIERIVIGKVDPAPRDRETVPPIPSDPEVEVERRVVGA